MTKFDANYIATENGWKTSLGCFPFLENKEYIKEVPTGRLIVYLIIGYNRLPDTPEDGATLELQHWKHSSANPPAAPGQGCGSAFLPRELRVATFFASYRWNSEVPSSGRLELSNTLVICWSGSRVAPGYIRCKSFSWLHMMHLRPYWKYP